MDFCSSPSKFAPTKCVETCSEIKKCIKSVLLFASTPPLVIIQPLVQRAASYGQSLHPIQGKQV